jgi:hypothetical protein
VISKPIKNDVSNYGINLKKIIQQSFQTIFQMLLAGRRTHKNKAFLLAHNFLWVREGFYGFSLWEVKMLWVQTLGVTLVLRLVQTIHESERMYSRFQG